MGNSPHFGIGRPRRTRGLRVILAAGAAILANPILAHADATDDRSVQLQVQIDALQKQINELKASGPASAPDVAAPSKDGPLTWKGITLYGVFDIGTTWQNHGAPLNDFNSYGLNQSVSKANANALFSASPNDLQQSRIGLKGAEDLGGGFTGLFQVETYFNPTSGQLSDGPHSLAQQYGVPLAQQTASNDSSKAGQAFSVAFAGVKNDTYGTVTFGRQQSIILDTFTLYDPVVTSQAFSALGSGTLGGGGATEDARLDSVLKYDNRIGPVHVGGLYQLQGNGGTAINATGQAVVGFTYGGLSLDGVYAHVSDAIALSTGSSTEWNGTPVSASGTSASNPLTGTVSDNTTWVLAARYATGPVTFFGGYEHIIYEDPGKPLATSGGTDLGYQVATFSNTAYVINKQLQVYWTGTRYQATDKLTLLSGLYYEDQNDYAGTALCSTSAHSAKIVGSTSCKGAEYFTSFVADYKWTSRIDTYAGLMYSHAYGGLGTSTVSVKSGSTSVLGQGYLHQEEINPTIGVRYAF